MNQLITLMQGMQGPVTFSMKVRYSLLFILGDIRVNHFSSWLACSLGSSFANVSGAAMKLHIMAKKADMSCIANVSCAIANSFVAVSIRICFAADASPEGADDEEPDDAAGVVLEEAEAAIA